ncbi:MAG: VOC family protein [Bacteroidota bacterium]
MRHLFIIIAASALFFSCNENSTEKTIIKIDTIADVNKTCEWNHKINWFEIPVLDFERAKTFYETILDIKIQAMTDSSDKEMGTYSMGFFADINDSTIVSGAIVESKDILPCEKGGVIIYLNANPDLNLALGKIEAAGGKITYPKTPIGENHEFGFMAMFIDSEGNTLALHSGN